MITYSIAMNKYTEPETLAAEIAVMPQVLQAARLHEGNDAVILARMVNGISQESWHKATHDYNLDHWYAFSVAADLDSQLEEISSDDKLAISPFREVEGALTSSMFVRLLKRELLRLNRNGGALSLLSACLVDRQRLATALGEGTVKRLEVLLGAILLNKLEACDSLGILRNGQYVCSLPGLGQLAARNFAEKTQEEFAEAARPFFPTGGISAGNGARCALGIVNLAQGESGSAPNLLKRVKSSLEVALTRDDILIYQESACAPLENTTLVQSSEKRFLFFGGDTQ